jgi:hypothetical protein
MKLRIADNNNTRDNLFKGSQVESYVWSILYPPDRTGVISQALMMADYCRESLIANIFSQISYKSKPEVVKALTGKEGKVYLAFIYRYDDTEEEDYYPWEKHIKPKPKKDTSGARKKLRLKLEAATKILNAVERKAKWPITRLIIPSNPWEKEIEMAVFKADRYWFYSPYMFSLLILILRASLFTNIYRLDKIPDLKNMARKFVAKKGNYCWSESSDTKEYAHDTVKYWVPVLKNCKMLHKGTTIIENFSTASYDFGLHNSHNEGISTLVEGDSCHGVIAKRFEKIRESISKE